MLVMIMAALAVQAPARPLDCATAAPSFMSAYAADLSGGDRSAIAARYSSQGAYSLGFQPKSFDSFNVIGRRYAGPEWQKPDKFSWRDLSYEQLGPDTCLAVGSFDWTVAARTVGFAYTAILRRENGSLRILLEHENPLHPMPPKK